MLGSSVTFVLGKVVSWVALIHLNHDAIPRDFGDDAGRSDGKALCVASHQRCLGGGEWVDGQAIDQHMVRLDRQ